MEARTPTNIDGLDTILDGGFPRPSANLIIGPIGCGARIIVQELAVNMLKQGFAVSYYSIETTATEVRHDLARLALDVADFEKQDFILLIYFPNLLTILKPFLKSINPETLSYKVG